MKNSSSKRQSNPGRKLNAVVAAALLCVSLPARADSVNCSDYRMDSPGESMEHVETRDQDGLGICFAETGAQIADAIRFSRLGDTNGGQYEQTSGKGIALGIADVTGFNSLARGGGTCWALNHVNKYGVCRQSSIEEAPGSTQLTAADGETGMPVRMSAVNEEILASSAAENEARNTFSPVQNDWGVTGFQAQCLPAIVSQNGLDPVQQTNFAKVLELAPSLTPNARTVLNACKRSFPFKNVKLSCEPPAEEKTPGKPDPQAIKNKLVSLLNPRSDGKKLLPVEIHYCSVILDKGRSTSSNETRKGRVSGGGDELGCGAHASLVIGRRMVNNKCQLLLRNSWGTDCDYYSDEINREGRCDGKGNVWLDADYLSKNTLGVVAPPEL